MKDVRDVRAWVDVPATDCCCCCCILDIFCMFCRFDVDVVIVVIAYVTYDTVLEVGNMYPVVDAT